MIDSGNCTNYVSYTVPHTPYMNQGILYQQSTAAFVWPLKIRECANGFILEYDYREYVAKDINDLCVLIKEKLKKAPKQ